MQGFLSGTAGGLAVDNDGVLWAGIGASIFAYRDGGFQIFDRYNTPMPVGQIAQTVVDKDNKKWFTNGQDVFTFNNEVWEFLPGPDNVRYVNGLVKDEDGKVWAWGGVEGADYRSSGSIIWTY